MIAPTAKSPLTPEITLCPRNAPLARVCNCCGTSGLLADVRHLSFGWADKTGGAHVGGATAVAICHSCRLATMELLTMEAKGYL